MLGSAGFLGPICAWYGKVTLCCSTSPRPFELKSLTDEITASIRLGSLGGPGLEIFQQLSNPYSLIPFGR